MNTGRLSSQFREPKETKHFLRTAQPHRLSTGTSRSEYVSSENPANRSKDTYPTDEKYDAELQVCSLAGMPEPFLEFQGDHQACDKH